MTYTLKVDWGYARTEAVARFLSAYGPTKRHGAELAELIQGGKEDDTYTIKVDWSDDVITLVVRVLFTRLEMLDHAMHRFHDKHRTDMSVYMDLTWQQIHCWAALGDICTYHATSIGFRVTGI